MKTPHTQTNHPSSVGTALPPTLIDKSSQFADLVSRLRIQPLIALDTESDSLFRYYPRVCLIQVTVFADPDNPEPQRVVDYLVDPLRLTDISALGPVLADPQIEIVMHAASNDILTLQRDFGFVFTNMFDTQLAARILGWPRVGLAAMLEEKFGVKSNKAMQRTNWGQRPLTDEQITYAQMDTHYLPALRLMLLDELQTRRRLKEAKEAFATLNQIDFAEREPNERNFWQMKGTREVPTAQTGILQALWEWREQEAQRQDRPPFKIVNDGQLIEMAIRAPQTQGNLHSIKGLSDHQLQRYGAALLRAIKEGQRRPQPEPPEYRPRPEWALDSNVLARFDALRQWRTKTATARGVDPDIVLTNETLMIIARNNPQTIEDLSAISGIGPWKVETYGAAILAQLTQLTS